MSLTDAAAFLAQQWPVFPCGKDKRPVTAHGFKDATRDPAALREMFRRPGAALIGVPTGAASDLAVIDLDVKDGAPGLEWLAANAHRLPRTRQHETRSGGRHLLFRYPQGRRIRNSVRGIAQGVDVRGEGGYIIVPPSDGYSVADDAMPAEMPAWLVDLIDPPAPPPAPRPAVAREWRDTSAPGSKYGLAALQDECDAICNAGFGSQETTLNGAALKIGALVAGGELEAGYAREMLIRAGLAMPSQPGREAWAPQEVRQKVERAFADGQRSPRQAPARPQRVTVTVDIPPEPPPYDEPPPHWAAPPADAERDYMDLGTPQKALPKDAPKTKAEGKPALWTDDDEWEEDAIAPRPWIARGYIMRRAVTILSGPGGGGKSSLTVGWSTALATGRMIGRFCGAEPGVCYRQLVYNVEDDRDEQRRRYSAALRQLGLAPSAIRGWIMRAGPNDVGTLIRHDPASGQFVFTDAWGELDILIGQIKPDVVWLDPLVELHTAEENDNTALRHVVAYLRALAVKHNCAIVLIHHARKGSAAGDAEGIRGAGSIVGASRVSVTVMPMTAEEAEAMHVAPDQRDLYFRVDGAKANYSRKGAANWHTLEEHELANGDTVAAVVAWQPDPARGAPGVDLDVMALIEAELARGTAGGPYSPRLAADQPRSAAALFARRGITAPGSQRAILRALQAKGWTVQRFRDRDNDPRSGLRSPDGKPEARWLDGQEAHDGTPE